MQPDLQIGVGDVSIGSPGVPKDLTLDEIEGISDYASFVKAGNEEFNKTADKGVGLTFWNLGKSAASKPNIELYI